MRKLPDGYIDEKTAAGVLRKPEKHLRMMHHSWGLTRVLHSPGKEPIYRADHVLKLRDKQRGLVV